MTTNYIGPGSDVSAPSSEVFEGVELRIREITDTLRGLRDVSLTIEPNPGSAITRALQALMLNLAVTCHAYADAVEEYDAEIAALDLPEKEKSIP